MNNFYSVLCNKLLKPIIKNYTTKRPISISSIFLIKRKPNSIKLNQNLKFDKMASQETDDILAPLRANVKEQGDLVRKLKSEGAPELDIKKAVHELNARKKILEDTELSLTPANIMFDRSRMENLLKRRFFYVPSFDIYQGIRGHFGGIFDFGPMGCAFKRNLLQLWYQFFVFKESMLEVECSVLTPEPALKASGHVDRFADLMVKDLLTGQCFRLDHLIKDHLEKIAADKKTTKELREECQDIVVKLDGMNKNEMADVMKKFNIKSPLDGNDLSEPMEFNLMFETQIGPTGLIKGYLRPETAQGIFVNFKHLLEFNKGKLPFAAAQIGLAFRNEISPRNGLNRVREFTMAEIEHFCDPKDKSHTKFNDINETELLLYSACNQMDGKAAKRCKICDAVNQGLVANQTLGYYMARIQLFLVKIGVDPSRLRFRQHMANEMAHYAQDCWDAEILTSYGWIECVGCADRAAYDLTQHTQATGERLAAEKQLNEPINVDVVEIVPNKSVFGKIFKQNTKLISDYLTKLSTKDVEEIEQRIETDGEYNLSLDGKEFKLNKEMITVKRYTKSVHVELIIPSVIEPSFGIGRIMYAVFEHNFKIRENDELRTYFTLPPIVAPLKCCILPLSSKDEFKPLIKKIGEALEELLVSHDVDDSSGSIGRRYVRTDEIAVPYCITIDFDSLKDNSVTLRERDTMTQVRLSLDEVADVVHKLSMNRLTWNDVTKKYPKFEQQESK